MKRLTKRKILRFILLITILIIILCLINDSWNYNKMKDAKYKKILLIGIDGMDPKITNQLIEEGKLPNFEKLKEEGTYTTLGTTLPPHSPVAWTTIATGTNPGKHNIFDFIRMDFERQLPELSLAKSVSGIAGTNYESYIKASPFWRITSKAGIPSTVIRWPVSFPPEEVKGNLLSGLGVPDVKGLLNDYTLYTSDNLEKFKDQKKLVEVENLGGVIKTYIEGPRTRKGGEIVSVKVPLRIDIVDDEKSVILIVQDSKYPMKVGGWSDWIRIKFKAGMFRNVYGICKAYMVGVEPFNMYLTSVQIDPITPMVDITYPKEYSSELAKEIGLYNTLGMPEDTSALVDSVIDNKVFLEQTEQIEEERDKMFWVEFEKFKKSESGILAFVYDTSDRIQHVFWEEKILVPEYNDENIKLNEAVVNYFVKKDNFLGRVVEQIGEDTALIIVSDHGFTSFEKNVDINSWLSKNGFMVLTKQPSEGNHGELFQFVDWSKTKAYSVGFNGIYLNLKDRENKGIVDASDKEKIVEEIIKELTDLIDPEIGEKAIFHLYKKEDVYSGDYIDRAPDIIIGFNPGYRMSWQTAVGGVTSDIIFDNEKVWDGDHLVDPSFVPGIIFTNFKINELEPNQIDIAPTVLELVGLEVPKDMDGRSLV